MGRCFNFAIIALVVRQCRVDVDGALGCFVGIFVVKLWQQKRMVFLVMFCCHVDIGIYLTESFNVMIGWHPCP
jgi:hypothetical protein